MASHLQVKRELDARADRRELHTEAKAGFRLAVGVLVAKADAHLGADAGADSDGDTVCLVAKGPFGRDLDETYSTVHSRTAVGIVDPDVSVGCPCLCADRHLGVRETDAQRRRLHFVLRADLNRDAHRLHLAASRIATLHDRDTRVERMPSLGIASLGISAAREITLLRARRVVGGLRTGQRRPRRAERRLVLRLVPVDIEHARLARLLRLSN